MEDNIVASSCLISSAKLLNIMPAETSDSNNTNNYYTLPPASKRMRHDNVDINIAPSTTATAKFKGVVPQQNGHWGAQIYAKHRRVWLGTFRSEKEAAMAYDSAAIKLRSGDSHRNFPCTERTAQEPAFQNHYSTEAVLNMIRDGSYPSKFAAFLCTLSQNNENIGICSPKQTRIVHGRDGHFSCSPLFQKELTPSDVGKLNRLVIPKKYAVRYFPYICESLEGKSTTEGASVDDIELVFYDKQMKQWKFRYCYWRSSQSFVFTRGWNKFVKEKNLNALDIITFYTCESGEKRKEAGERFCLIDVSYKGGDQSKNCLVECQGIDHDDQSLEVELELNLGKSVGYKVDDTDDKGPYSKSEQRVLNVDEKGIRIFGVHIS